MIILDIACDDNNKTVANRSRIPKLLEYEHIYIHTNAYIGWHMICVAWKRINFESNYNFQQENTLRPQPPSIDLVCSWPKSQFYENENTNSMIIDSRNEIRIINIASSSTSSWELHFIELLSAQTHGNWENRAFLYCCSLRRSRENCVCCSFLFEKT